MSRKIEFFRASPDGRNAVEKFVSKDLKKLPGVREQLVDQLKVLADTPIATLRSTHRIEHVRGEILSFRFSGKDHWVRLYLALWPNDDDVLILLAVLKKQNRLDSDDIKQAEHNLAIQIARVRAAETS